MAAPIRACGALVERADPLGPALRVTVAEARLGRVRRAADPAVEVAGVDQGHPHPGFQCSLDRGGAHRVRVIVWLSAVTVMDVVKLADDGDAGERHFGVRRASERAHRVGIDRGGERVHLLAPGPERAPPGPLGPPPQSALEHMRVGVGQARDDEAGQDLRSVRRRRDARLHGLDPLTGRLDQHAAMNVPATQPRPLTPEAAHRGASAPAAYGAIRRRNAAA